MNRSGSLTFIFLLLFSLFVSTFAGADVRSEEESAIHRKIQSGHFTVATEMIDRFLMDDQIPPQRVLYWRFQQERMKRIRYDYRGTEEAALKYIRRYDPQVSPEQIARWKESGAFLVRMIDDQECYFRQAGENLFRIDPQAAALRRRIDGPGDLTFRNFLREHVQNLAKKPALSVGSSENEAQNIRMKYTLTVPADRVPAGETIRCWLPYPYRGHRRQDQVELIQSNLTDPIISPDSFDHSTIYSEKIAESGQATVFQVEFRFRCKSEYFPVPTEEFRKSVKPYRKDSELYKNYTSQNETHILFTPAIEQYSREVVGDEKDPVRILEKIYASIVRDIPWISAPEYSTVENIPGFVLDHQGGDCGMVALLLITMCRYHGIPAKWQSGFMLYPYHKNLHDWAEVYFEGVGWIPVDPSQGSLRLFKEEPLVPFYLGGIDAYRLILNEDFSDRLYPAKIHPRSETVDFQRGEVEWRGGNLYFNQWNWDFFVDYPE